MVPMPESVSISSRSAWGTVPLMIWAALTPESLIFFPDHLELAFPDQRFLLFRSERFSAPGFPECSGILQFLPGTFQFLSGAVPGIPKGGFTGLIFRRTFQFPDLSVNG